SDVQKIIHHHGLDEVMDALINRLERAMKIFDDQLIDIPARSGFHYEEPKPGLVEWMPLYTRGGQIVIKLVGYHPTNPEGYGLPTILSTISSYDSKSGHLMGLMDGVLSTAIRTGAASAVASRFLAHPESSTLGLIGCGAQAVTQLHALSRVFNLKRILLYDVLPEVVSSFEDRCSALKLDVEYVSSNIREIIETSDIVCTATSIDVGAGPLFEGLETRPHLHVNAIGSDFPGKVELPLDLLHKSFVCPDFKAQAVEEGECQQLEDQFIGPDILEVVRNQEKYAYTQAQLSVFDSTGWALEDKVIMELFMEYAADLGLGQEIEIESIPSDAKNPYHFVEADVKASEQPSGTLINS
ncbi:MAG: ornithine cyclodeaminase family protein, partial [Bacteroidota bacterium]